MERVYQERVFSAYIASFPGIFGLALIAFFIWGKYFSNFEDKSSAWLFLGAGIFFLLVAINFSFLNIIVSARGFSARFGVISHSISINNIAGTYQDKASKVHYRGFGIRWGWVNGKRRLVYDATDTPHVVIRQKQNSKREFVFSTQNPDAVIKAIRTVVKQD